MVINPFEEAATYPAVFYNNLFVDRPLTQKIPPFGRIFEFLAVSAVPSLLFGGRPPAIFPAIITVRVDSVEGHALWPLAHILDKCLKLRPFWADCDPPTTVVGVADRLRIVASLQHPPPRSVQWVQGVTVLQAFTAPTRPAVPLLHTESVDPLSVAALTLVQVLTSVTLLW